PAIWARDRVQMKEPGFKSDWTLARSLGLGIAFFLLAFLSPVIYDIDGISMVEVAESIVLRGSFAVSSNCGIAGIGGLYYSKFYPLLSVVAIPLVGLGALAARLTNL